MSILNAAPKEKHSEVKRMTDFNRISYFTSFHMNKEVYLDPQFNKNGAFTEKLLSHNAFIMAGKVGLITCASAGFGFALGFIMSGFEFNSSRVVNTDVPSRSQIK